MKYLIIIIMLQFKSGMLFSQGTKVVNEEWYIDKETSQLDLGFDTLILNNWSVVKIASDVGAIQINAHHLVVNGTAFIYSETKEGYHVPFKLKKATSGSNYADENKKHGNHGRKGLTGGGGVNGTNISLNIGIDHLDQLVIISKGSSGGCGGIGEFGGNGAPSECIGDYGSGGNGGNGGNGGLVQVNYTSNNNISFYIDSTISIDPFYNHGFTNQMYSFDSLFDHFYYEEDMENNQILCVKEIMKPLEKFSHIDSLYCFKYYPESCGYNMEIKNYDKAPLEMLETFHVGFLKNGGVKFLYTETEKIVYFPLRKNLKET